MFILKRDESICFDTVLEVLILNGLEGNIIRGGRLFSCENKKAGEVSRAASAKFNALMITEGLRQVKVKNQIAGRILLGKRVSSEVEDTKMRIVLEAPFATVEDTAKELGVSKSRLKRLVYLMKAQATVARRTSGNKITHKSGARKLTSARKIARGKKKVAR